MPEKKQSAWRFLWRSEDIRRKLLITLGILVIFRVAAVIPVPGVNTAALESFFQTNGAGFLGFLNLLSGGTVKNFSLMAMGVYPYITAQIILQLLVPIIPSLQKRMQEDQREGRKWMEKWTMYLTVPMAMLSAIGQINIFNSLSATPIIPFGWSQAMWVQSVTTVLTMTAGTMFAIWLGELISEYGIRGQGLSLIIFAGIVSQIPHNLYALWLDEQNRWILMTAMGRDHCRYRSGDCICPAGTPECADHVPAQEPDLLCHEPRQSGENAPAFPAVDGQPGRHDPVDLCQCDPAVPGDYCELLC